VKPAGLIVFATALMCAISGAAHASDGLTLRGYGTAVVDGVLSPGEWDAAGQYDFRANRSPAEGGGTVPATLFVMNDATNLYLALRVGVTDLGYSAFDGIFMPSEQNPFGPGNDILRATPTLFEDYHYQQTAPNTWDWIADVADGGTRDGTAAAMQYSGYAVFEVSHPLDSADNGHDFSLTIFSHISFIASFQHCVAGSCGNTIVPDFGTSKVVVVSGTHVPPDTTITEGPREGAEIPDYGVFAFTGTDDVAPPSELTYECKVDEEEWSECFSPDLFTTAEGWHTLSVRALDEMGNADPTPAHRRWRIDTQAPSKPKIARAGTTTFRFSATDRGTPPRRLRFRCAIDSKRLHACGSRLRAKLPARRHVLRVRAVDPAGNESDVKVVRFTVWRPAP
jgi:hypothetical protein